MQPRTLCPTCSAPFPPDALKCSYCGTPSPLAYERQRVAQQVDYERQRFAQQVDAASRIQRMRANLQTAEQNANTGFLLSVASFAVCCLPVQLAGVFLGLRAMRLAKSEGVAAPTRAYLAVSVGALGVALVGLIGLIAFVDDRGDAKRLAETKARLEGKRDAVVLVPEVACALAEERLLEEGHAGRKTGLREVACDGPLAVDGERASLRNVRVAYRSTRHTLTACLSRGTRWFVVKLTTEPDCTAAPDAGSAASAGPSSTSAPSAPAPSASVTTVAPRGKGPLPSTSAKRR